VAHGREKHFAAWRVTVLSEQIRLNELSLLFRVER
jgi:hypothetical protein